MDDTATSVLLIPERMQAAALGGAAEIIVEARPASGAVRRFLHIFDEFERQEKVNSSSAASPVPESEKRVHEQRLKELRWACETLWSDQYLQPYLRCPDMVLWPDLESLRRAVEVVQTLHMYGRRHTNARDGEALSRAMQTIERDVRYAGVHPIKEAPVAGQLVPYRVSQWLRSTGPVQLSLPDSLERPEGEATVGQSAWLVEPNMTMLMASDALKLPMTQRTVERLVELVKAPSLAPSSPEDARKTWHALVHAHTRSLLDGTVALAGSFADAVTAFQTSEDVILQLAHHAAEEVGARVRLRMGVLVTVIHRELMFLVTGKHPKSSISAEERSSLQRLTELDVDALQAGGLLRCVAARLARSEVDKVVREVFLSPALTALSEGADGLAKHYSVEELGVVDSAGLTVYKVSAPHNPFLIVHGPRVLGGVTGHEGMSLLLKRKGEAESDAEYRQSAAQIALEEPSGRTRPSAAPSSAQRSTVQLRGEELHAAITRGVVTALASEPMSKTDLVNQAALLPLAGVPEFDNILKQVLRARTDYKNRKYVLRQ